MLGEEEDGKQEAESDGMYWRLFVAPCLDRADDEQTFNRKVFMIMSANLGYTLAFLGVIFLYFAGTDPAASNIIFSAATLLLGLVVFVFYMHLRVTESCTELSFLLYLSFWVLILLIMGIAFADEAYPIGAAMFIWSLLAVVLRCLSRRAAIVFFSFVILLEWILSFSQQFGWGITGSPHNLKQHGLFGGTLSSKSYVGIQTVIRLVFTLTLSCVAGTAVVYFCTNEEEEVKFYEQLSDQIEAATNDLCALQLESGMSNCMAAESAIRNRMGGKAVHINRITTSMFKLLNQLQEFKPYIPQSYFAMVENRTPRQTHLSSPGMGPVTLPAALQSSGAAGGHNSSPLGRRESTPWLEDSEDEDGSSDRPLTEDELQSVGTPMNRSQVSGQNLTVILSPNGKRGNHPQGKYANSKHPNIPHLESEGSIISVQSEIFGDFGPSSASVRSGGGASGHSGGAHSYRLTGPHSSKGFVITTKRISVVCFNVVDFHGTVRKGIEVATKVQSHMLYTIQNHVREHRGIIDYFQGDHIWASFNASGNAAAHAKKAAVATLSAISELEKNLNITLTAGLSTGPAAVGNMGIDDLKRYCMIGPVVAQASLLERLTKCYPGVSCLAPGTALGDIGFDCFYQAVDVLALPGAKPGVIASLEAVKEVTDAIPNTEWMYQLEREERADPFAHVNAAFVSAMDGDADAAERCLEAGSSRKSKRAKIGEQGARNIIEQLRNGSPFIGTDLGMYYDRIAPSSQKHDFNIAQPGTSGAPRTSTSSNNNNRLGATESMHRKGSSNSLSSNRSMDSATRKMMEGSAGKLLALTPHQPALHNKPPLSTGGRQTPLGGPLCLDSDDPGFLPSPPSGAAQNGQRARSDSGQAMSTSGQGQALSISQESAESRGIIPMVKTEDPARRRSSPIVPTFTTSDLTEVEVIADSSTERFNSASQSDAF